MIGQRKEMPGDMEPIEFWKMSGSGNDFILIDNRGDRSGMNRWVPW